MEIAKTNIEATNGDRQLWSELCPSSTWEKTYPGNNSINKNTNNNKTIRKRHRKAVWVCIGVFVWPMSSAANQMCKWSTAHRRCRLSTSVHGFFAHANASLARVELQIEVYLQDHQHSSTHTQADTHTHTWTEAHTQTHTHPSSQTHSHLLLFSSPFFCRSVCFAV